jgi:hypothetical protein
MRGGEITVNEKPKVETIYPDGHEWEACGWIKYGRSSALAGQSQEVPVEWYSDLEAAKAAHPKATVSESPRWRGNRPMVPDCPPSDFDPADAGECWHENDY